MIAALLGCYAGWMIPFCVGEIALYNDSYEIFSTAIMVCRKSTSSNHSRKCNEVETADLWLGSKKAT
jgi:hypothetical protein